MNFDIRIACADDAKQVLSLYRDAKGSAFCVWDDSYPDIPELEHDLETKSLYVMTHGGAVVGAVSVVPENEMDTFECWACKDAKEIARVVISESYQGRGLALELVKFIEAMLRKDSCNAIHLSVAKTNIPAYKTYIKAGFVTVSEADMYGSRYYLMEKLLAVGKA